MRVLVLCFALLILLSPIMLAEADEQRDQANAALQILDTWSTKQPENDDRYLHIVCWTPNDRPLPADYQSRLTRNHEAHSGLLSQRNGTVWIQRAHDWIAIR